MRLRTAPPEPSRHISPRGAILAYHAVDDDGGVLSTPPAVFAAHMNALHELDVRVLPLVALARAMANGTDEHVVAITFDDGFRSVCDRAWPVLQRFGFPATIFVVSDYCGRSNNWPGQPAGIPRRPLLDWNTLRTMSLGGFDVGSHTRTHADLTRLPPAEITEEMSASKKAIEDAVGRLVETFAYPYGATDARVRGIAARYFRVACSTRLAFVTGASDPLDLERLEMFYFRRPALLRYLSTPAGRLYVRLRGFTRQLRSGLSAPASDAVGSRRREDGAHADRAEAPRS